MNTADNNVVIDVKLPSDWSGLSQKQLKFAFDIIGREETKEYLVTHCFLKWSGLKVITRDKLSGDYVLKFGKQIIEISADEMTVWMRPLEWLADVPDCPVCLNKIGRHKAVNVDFSGVVFDKYLDATAIWNAFAKSQNENALRELALVLYGFRPKRIKPYLKACFIFWMGSLNKFLSSQFPHLFSSGKNVDGTGTLAAPSLEDSSNAMLRALTKGDVLKEKDVLNVDTWRALTELEAIANEADMINQSIKNDTK